MKNLMLALTLLAVPALSNAAEMAPSLGMLHCTENGTNPTLIIWADDFSAPTYLGPRESYTLPSNPVVRLDGDTELLKERNYRMTGAIVDGKKGVQRLAQYRLTSLGFARVIRKAVKALGNEGCVAQANLVRSDVELDVTPEAGAPRVIAPLRTTISCEFLVQTDATKCAVSRDSGGH